MNFSDINDDELFARMRQLGAWYGSIAIRFTRRWVATEGRYTREPGEKVVISWRHREALGAGGEYFSFMGHEIPRASFEVVAEFPPLPPELPLRDATDHVALAESA